MPNQDRNNLKMCFRVSETLKQMVEKAVQVGGYINASDFIRVAIRDKLRFMGIVEGKRECVSCGKILTRRDIMKSQGWHCEKCFTKIFQR